MDHCHEQPSCHSFQSKATLPDCLGDSKTTLTDLALLIVGVFVKAFPKPSIENLMLSSKGSVGAACDGTSLCHSILAGLIESCVDTLQLHAGEGESSGQVSWADRQKLECRPQGRA